MSTTVKPGTWRGVGNVNALVGAVGPQQCVPSRYVHAY
jgi:hypothetical protein